VLGNDSEQSRNEMHVNRNDKLKDDKMKEVGFFNPRWTETLLNPETIKNMHV